MEEFSSLSIKTSKKIHITYKKNLVTKKVNNLKNEEKSTKDFSLKIVKNAAAPDRRECDRASRIDRLHRPIRCGKKDV